MPAKCVIIVNHGSVEPITRALIREDFPILLHTCKESRQLALTKYQSDLRKTWKYTKGRKSTVLRRILQRLGLGGQAGTVPEMVSSIEVYMNCHHENNDRFKHLAELNDIPCTSIIAPLRFDPNDDFLLLQTPFLQVHQTSWPNNKLLGPWNTQQIEQVRNLALKLDRMDGNRRKHPIGRFWARTKVCLQRHAAFINGPTSL